MDLQQQITVTIAHFVSRIGNTITVHCIKSYIRNKPPGFSTFLDAIVLDFLRIYGFGAWFSTFVLLSGVWFHEYIPLEFAYILSVMMEFMLPLLLLHLLSVFVTKYFSIFYSVLINSIENENSVRYRIRTFIIILNVFIIFVELCILSDLTKLIHFYVITRGYDDGSEVPKLTGVLFNLNILMALIIQIKVEMDSIKMKDPNGKIARILIFFKNSNGSDNDSVKSVGDVISVSIIRLIMICSICTVILFFLTGNLIVMSIFEIITIFFIEMTAWLFCPLLYILSKENLKKYSFKKLKKMFRIQNTIEIQ